MPDYYEGLTEMPAGDSGTSAAVATRDSISVE